MYGYHPVIAFLVFWGVNTLSLWVATRIFSSVSFDSTATLWISGLLLGIVNTFVRPILVVLTLPLTLVSLGFFLLVINALMLLLVAWLVPGFHLAGFWKGFFVALFVSIFSYLINLLLSR